MPVLWLSKEEAYYVLRGIIWIFCLSRQKYPELVSLFSILWHSSEQKYLEDALGLSVCLSLNKF